MSKLIAIWGCPNSGKTTFTVRLAKAINDETGAKTICVFADSATPTLPVLFPNTKAAELRSIGTVLSQTEITPAAVLKNLVTTDKAGNIGFMGYTDGENRWSYPEYSGDKAAAFLDALSNLAGYVVVDCGDKLTGTLAFAAIRNADTIFRICKPDLKAISFFSSQTPLYGDLKYRMDEHQPILNVLEQGLYMPIEEAAQHFKCGKFIIPYAAEIRQQAMHGLFLDKVSNTAYNNAIKKMLAVVI
jgi:MinD-like ATPase involved in chromosome partitioning or flagellar assembly